MINNGLPTNEDIEQVLGKYPGLKVVDNQSKTIEGEVEIIDANGYYWTKYNIRIEFHQRFPLQFPKLFEIGGRIPKEADWHIYDDGSCCTTVRQKELIAAKDGISTCRFLDEYGIPYLANHRYKELYGHYASGEYGHGSNGEVEFLIEIFKTSNRKVICLGLRMILTHFSLPRQGLCFCGSGMKFRNCHKAALNILSGLAKKEIGHLLELILR